MKFLKGLLLVGVILILIYLVLCALGPASFDMERSIVIDAPASQVYSHLDDFSRWEAWSPWAKRDTAMVNTFSKDPASGLGSWQEWTSVTQGNGKQTIIEVRPNEFMRTRLDFVDWPEPSFSNWVLESQEEGGTKVTWSMDGSKVPFMLRGMMLMANAKASIEKDYEEGLQNLKTYVESNPVFEPMSEMKEDQWYVGSMAKDVSMEDLESGNVHAQGYGAIGQFLAEAEVDMAGFPMSIVHRFTKESMDLELAIPVTDSMAVPENLTLGKIPGGEFLYTVHYGPYNSVESTWDMIGDYIEANNIQVRWLPMEVYTNDPTTVEESEIETKIVFPVAK